MHKLSAGDTVRVRSAADIMASLAADGTRDGLPFMPEMLAWCGRQVTVFKRIHKTCDLQYGTGGLHAGRFVTLVGARCDGAAHGGCEAACTLLWHEDWLATPATQGMQQVAAQTPATLPTDWSVKQRSSDGSVLRYRCQVTEQAAYTRPLNPLNPRPYIEDLSSGNISLREFLRGLYRTAYRWALSLGIGYRALVRTYNTIQRRIGGAPHPYVQGTLQKTPVSTLDLAPGDWVRVKPFDEIVGTLDRNNKNRGLWFVPQEMGDHCGHRYRVERRVSRILNEKTGEMIEFKTPSVILDGVYCHGSAIERRVFCPRASALMWREIWLSREPAAPTESLSVTSQTSR